MKRIENSIRNLRYGMLHQMLDVVLKFALRTVLVRVMGDAVVGLNGLFTEVLSMLSLAELGVGSAITYSLYKPLSEGDEKRVASLMTLFKRAYECIALVIFVIGIALMPWIHLLVRKVDFDVGYIRLIYFLFLVSTASSYLFSYKSALFNADQKSYKNTVAAMVSDIFTVLSKIAALIVWRSFTVFLVLEIAGRLANNLFVNVSANRMYPFLRKKTPLPDKTDRKEIFRNIRHLFIGRLSGVITNSTDNTLISLMDSTLSVGIYSNYSMVFSSARTFLGQFTKAISGSIGNLMAEESGERCYASLKRLTMLMFLPGSVICACFFSQLSPLVSLWLGSERVLGNAVLYVLTLNFFFYAVREPLWQFMTVSGLFAKDKNISIIGTTVNLVLSIILGLRLGMLGIFIGTTATLVIQYVLKAVLLCKERFHVSPAGFFLYTGAFLLTTAAACLGCGALCQWIHTGSALLDLAIGLCLTAALTGLIDMALFWRTDEMRYCVGAVAQRLSGKLPFLKRWADRGERPLRVAMIGHKRIPSREGGVEIVVKELAVRMAKMGLCVDAYNRWDLFTEGGKVGGKTYEGVRIRQIPTPHDGKLNAFVYSVLATLASLFHRYDVYHYHAIGSCAMLWLPHFLGMRTVATVHGLDWQRAKWSRFASIYLRFGEKMAARFADEVIVLSRGNKQYFLDTYGRETLLIPNGMDKQDAPQPDAITARFGFGRKDFVLYLGRLVPEKGVHYLLDAYLGVDTNLRLAVAGKLDWDTEYCRRLAEMAKRDPRVTLLDFVQGRELEELFGNCSVYVLPSDVEGMPLSLLEAISYGARCLVSDIDENVDAAKGCARLFRHSDVNALREQLQDLLDHPDMPTAEAGATWESWDEVTNKTLDVYRRVLASGGRPTKPDNEVNIHVS